MVSSVSARRGDLKINKGSGSVYWYESRPEEGGRYVLNKHAAKSNTVVVNDSMNVRTRVHEYGGGAFGTLPPDLGGTLAVDFKTQQLFHINIDNDPCRVKALTSDALPYRYADFVYSAKYNRIFSVREDHSQSRPSDVVNSIVSIPFETENTGTSEGKSQFPQQTVICEGYDFYSTPRVSADCKYLAWVCWNHPSMPWDKTELWIGRLNGDGSAVREATCLCGNGTSEESIMQPSFSPNSKYLYFISDRRNGFWNLHRYSFESQTIECILEKDVEVGAAQWQFGRKYFDIAENGNVCAIVGKELYVFDETNAVVGTYKAKSDDGVDLAPSDVVSSPLDDNTCFVMAGSETTPSGVYRWNLAENKLSMVSNKVHVPHVEYFSKPKLIEFPTANDKTAFAQLYLPHNPTHETSSATDKPPLLVKIHGGPTSYVSTTFRIDIQYWTSRGFAVADVAYGGSTGFGREFRERLNGNWGIVDVEDCCNCAEYLASEGIVDGQRLAIDGGSAGGFTTLACLTTRKTFRAGTSFYGVADLTALAQDTHKFESRYLDGLVGPYPECKSVYDERSPINHVDGLNCPLLLLQGDEDMIVPLNQATTMKAACDAKKIPCALFVFEGEQHGFRKAENIQNALGYELAFYGAIFGFKTDASDEIEKAVASRL